MASTPSTQELSYNPSAIINIFTNSLQNDATRKAFRIKGVYMEGNGINYRGFFYDSLKDETGDTSLTLVVPAVIKGHIKNRQIIECNAYLSKKVQLNSGRIELQVNLIDLISQAKSSFTEEQVRVFELMQRKAAIGHKDVTSFIKTKIINNEPVAISIIMGRSGIIDSDIKQQLQEAIALYTINFIKVNLTSEQEIIQALKINDNKTDLLIVARGGGDNLGTFDSLKIAEEALSLNSYFVTAIGHAEDSPLLEKLADKAFITPTALGQYLKDVYNSTIEQLQNSKAKLVDDVKAQLQANYQHQLQVLNEKLQNTEQINRKEIAVLERQLQEATNERTSLAKQIDELEKKAGRPSVYFILLILAALLIGWLLGRLF